MERDWTCTRKKNIKWSPKKPMPLIKAIIDDEWQSNQEKSVNKNNKSTVNLTVVCAPTPTSKHKNEEPTVNSMVVSKSAFASKHKNNESTLPVTKKQKPFTLA
jgi:hypothetical protein